MSEAGARVNPRHRLDWVNPRHRLDCRPRQRGVTVNCFACVRSLGPFLLSRLRGYAWECARQCGAPRVKGLRVKG